ncbi:uncharacterized protein LOC143918710 [Arctopsyche grandis]|uniref:uncharacterized protein LOC143918710 n=1 Tax=Arctopsyche grandis TaxID=121162 RepID=UPI00406D9A89
MSLYDTPEDIAFNLQQCPYNESHLIEPSRMAFHVARCKNTSTKKMATCPFDATHKMEENALDNHVKNCPARIAFDRHKYAVGEQSGVVGADVLEHDIEFVGETWDLNATPYNPAAGKSSDVLFIPHGAKPSERRAFRQEQRRNYKQKRDN